MSFINQSAFRFTYSVSTNLREAPAIDKSYCKRVRFVNVMRGASLNCAGVNRHFFVFRLVELAVARPLRMRPDADETELSTVEMGGVVAVAIKSHFRRIAVSKRDAHSVQRRRARSILEHRSR
jgi:hypothetical protein